VCSPSLCVIIILSRSFSDGELSSVSTKVANRACRLLSLTNHASYIINELIKGRDIFSFNLVVVELLQIKLSVFSINSLACYKEVLLRTVT